MREAERMAAALPECWAHRVASCGGVVHEEDGLAVCLTGVPDDPFNPTLVRRLPSDPDAALEAAEAHYASTELSFGIDLEASLHRDVRAAVKQRGLRNVETRPGMALVPNDLRPPPAPVGIAFEAVDDASTLATVAETDAASFGGDVAAMRAFLPAAMLDDPAQRVFVARIDGQVVGTGESAFADGVLGIFGIATLPAFRRRGIGSALTAALILDRADEADLAVLQSSTLGLGAYGRLGFRSMSTWEVWVMPRP
jgi:ribosomal protein S18 acetylase RimI-like enzyme